MLLYPGDFKNSDNLTKFSFLYEEQVKFFCHKLHYYNKMYMHEAERRQTSLNSRRPLRNIYCLIIVASVTEFVLCTRVTFSLNCLMWKFQFLITIGSTSFHIKVVPTAVALQQIAVNSKLCSTGGASCYIFRELVSFCILFLQ